MKKTNKPQLIFVTGKGGVGKSTISLALADRFLKQGLSVSLLALNPLEHKPSHIPIYHHSVEDYLSEYLSYFFPAKKLIHKALSSHLSSTLLKLTPGLQDVAALSKITSGPRGFGKPVKEDIIIIDSYSTGHFQSFLQAPRSFSTIAPLGPIRNICDDVGAVIKKAHFLVVSLPDKWSLLESEETLSFLKSWKAENLYHCINCTLKDTFLEELVQWNEKPLLLEFYEKNLKLQKENLKNISKDIELENFYELSQENLMNEVSQKLERFCEKF